MGPDQPSRLHFSWDVRNAPWTDAKGPQQGYYDAVLLWKSFHDKLPDGNPNKIPSDLQGIMLQSQLFGRASELVKKLSTTIIQSDTGAMAIAKAIHKCDPLSVITDTFGKFTTVLQTIRGANETFRNFESRFDAAVCGYNSAAPNSKLPESLIAFVLVKNANLEDSQRVSILSASAPKVDEVDQDNIDDTLTQVKYEDVASIVRLFDKPKENYEYGSSRKPLVAGSIHNRSRNNYRRGKPMSEAVLNRYKQRTKCKGCNKPGHRIQDNKCDPDDVIAFQKEKANLSELDVMINTRSLITKKSLQ